ncbi:MAG: AraC family transcriptional regulator [Carboxylicivirga sp.]|jgi:AraC family cel operon transcriptional repressor|nr:AraC family transcriptional regulator [Carboxylicivirga sp.]
MNNSHFRLDTFVGHPNEVFHVARTTISSQDDLQLHNHGFAEVFWIKEGRGIHIINGHKLPICKGQLCMIRPSDEHTFRLDKNHESLVITNIAFGQDSLKYFKERYFNDSHSYFWTDNTLPFTIQLDSDQLNELSAITNRLISQPHDFLHLDYIMIHVFRLLNTLQREQLHIPHWLAYALDNYNTPDKFKDGIKGFVALTERSVDHVNRVLQQHLKQTLTETVIKARLQYACRQLIMTNSSIKTICFDCGFDSISYFYRLFKKHIGQTPVQYRKKNHKVF